MIKNFTQINLKDDNSLRGKLLIAMPQMPSPPYQQTIILIKHQSAQEITGVMINHKLEGLTFHDLLTQVNVYIPKNFKDTFIYYGGPVDIRKGFVVHSLDYCLLTTDRVTKDIGVTASLEVLKDISLGKGPEQQIMVLGFCKWTPQQLMEEIAQNHWLITDALPTMLYEFSVEARWKMGYAQMNIALEAMSFETSPLIQ